MHGDELPAGKRKMVNLELWGDLLDGVDRLCVRYERNRTSMIRRLLKHAIASVERENPADV